MQRQKVKSSHIKSIGYDCKLSTLEVEFDGLTIYHYFKVPESVYISLMSAKSHGTYLSQSVRDVYRFRKIR